ncbi:unnamed protein product [Dovyalis caffra]|uniref:Uncharacterized protein n=1 Tax=Dovyalis caffra TaxID=77055 RepID=A0AAV1QU92_9ROSI|nr:unnamed protein product [Dovyalis caffra]
MIKLIYLHYRSTPNRKYFLLLNSPVIAGQMQNYLQAIETVLKSTKQPIFSQWAIVNYNPTLTEVKCLEVEISRALANAERPAFFESLESLVSQLRKERTYCKGHGYTKTATSMPDLLALARGVVVQVSVRSQKQKTTNDNAE